MDRPNKKMVKNMKCTICGIDLDMVDLKDRFYSRGYIWHRGCAKIFKYVPSDEEYVDFPSEGKFFPTTLIH